MPRREWRGGQFLRRKPHRVVAGFERADRPWGCLGPEEPRNQPSVARPQRHRSLQRAHRARAIKGEFFAQLAPHALRWSLAPLALAAEAGERPGRDTGGCGPLFQQISPRQIPQNHAAIGGPRIVLALAGTFLGHESIIAPVVPRILHAVVFRPLSITGLGAVSPFGTGLRAYVEGLRCGRQGVSPLRFSHPILKSRVAACVHPEHFDPLTVITEADIKRLPRLIPMALSAARQALSMAGFGDINDDHARSRRVGLVLGTGGGGIDFSIDQIAAMQAGRNPSLWSITNATHGNLAGELSIRLGLRGPSLCISTGCASSTDAAGLALQMLAGEAAQSTLDAMVVIGADAHVRWETIYGMELLGVISTKDHAAAGEDPCTASRPFDLSRDGFVLGEGAWAIVLERPGASASRSRIRLCGYAATCDAHHRVRPDPAMQESVRAMHDAIASAGLLPTAINAVHYHGTSTQLNDRLESLSVASAFASHAPSLIGHSVKGAIGHPQGASGLAALVATVGCATSDSPFLPPTLNLTMPDPVCPLNYSPQTPVPLSDLPLFRASRSAPAPPPPPLRFTRSSTRSPSVPRTPRLSSRLISNPSPRRATISLPGFSLPSAMRYRSIGTTAIKVSEIGFGCWTMGGPNWSLSNGAPIGWADPNEDELLAGIKVGLDAGVNHWDNADIYGNGRAERRLAAAFHKLGTKRAEQVIATKVGHFHGTAPWAYQPSHILSQCEQSLRNLRTDYIDIYYFHHGTFTGPGGAEVNGQPHDYLHEAAAVMHGLVKAGKVRAIGQSAYSDEDFERAIPVVKPDVLQNKANLRFDAPIRPGSKVQQLMDKHGCTFVAFGPLDQGILLDKFDPDSPPKFGAGEVRANRKDFAPETLRGVRGKLVKAKARFGSTIDDLSSMASRWVLAHPNVCSTIPGFRNASQARCNVRAGTDAPMSAEDVQFLRTLFAS